MHVLTWRTNLSSRPVTTEDLSTMTAAALIENLVLMLDRGAMPVLRAKMLDGQPISVGFYLVPDSTGLCADCRKKVN